MKGDESMAKNVRPNNGPQKGERRQRLHENQNNIGDPKNPPGYTNFNGEPIE